MVFHSNFTDLDTLIYNSYILTEDINPFFCYNSDPNNSYMNFSFVQIYIYIRIHTCDYIHNFTVENKHDKIKIGKDNRNKE